jgi:hypothetical protein
VLVVLETSITGLIVLGIIISANQNESWSIIQFYSCDVSCQYL